MSEHDISDKLAINFLPRVTVLIASDNPRLLDPIRSQDYGKIIFRTKSKEMDTPTFFNAAIEETRSITDLYFFITEFAYISNPQAVSRVVEKFLVDDMLYAGIYTDSLRVENGYVSPEFLPAFSPKLILQDMVTNNPLIVQQQFLPPNPFKKGIAQLFFFNLIRVVGAKTAITHLAEPIYYIIRKPFDVQKDLNIILHE